MRNPTEAEEAAITLRDSWDLGNRPLDNLVQTTEDRGVVVLSWDDASGRFDGLSGMCGAYPVTVINTKRSSDRIRFSLAHEIGHLVMDTSPMATGDEESLAHRFAAALLVPAEHAIRELGSRRTWLDWGELKVLKRKYGLSMAAWIRRARDLEIINESAYESMNRQIRTSGWHKDEPGKYLGDEEPLLLKQMAQRAVSEGLLSPDRVSRVTNDILDIDEDTDSVSGYPTAIDLLEMDEVDREYWMTKMFDLAEKMEFEVFEAFGEEEF